MRLNRVYVDCPIQCEQSLALPSDAVRHLVTVLKMRVGEDIVVFNGDGFQYQATIERIDKKCTMVRVNTRQNIENESPLSLHLFQAVSRGDKMDLTIQKSVELGVHSITPIFTERCGVKLNSDRLEKKQRHWQKIIQSACEQCGRNRIPELKPAVQFASLLQQPMDWNKTLILNPHSGTRLSNLPKTDALQLIIGPEGGLSDSEIEQLEKQNCLSVQLGPRILRTETAGLAVISVLQSLMGDF